MLAAVAALALVPALALAEPPGLDRWSKNHPQASVELGEWVRQHPQAARLMFEWDGTHRPGTLFSRTAGSTPSLRTREGPPGCAARLSPAIGASPALLRGL